MTSPLHVLVDGERWDKYFANYEHDGKTYSFNFYARNDAEAEETLRAIRTTAVESFKIEGEIPASVPCSGLIARGFCFIANLFKL